MPVGAIKAQRIHDGFALRRIYDLANAQQWVAARNSEKVGDERIGGGSVDFFIGVAQFDFVIALENGEKRFARDGGVEQTGKFRGVEIGGFEG